VKSGDGTDKRTRNEAERERGQVTIEAGEQIGRVETDIGGLYVVSRAPRESIGRLGVREDQSATAGWVEKEGASCDCPFRRNRLDPERERHMHG